MIEKSEKSAIIISYYFRLLAKGIKVDKNELISKLSIFSKKEIIEFFSNIIKGNDKTVTETLEKSNIKVTYLKINKNKDNFNTLHSPMITEFNKNNNNYIKFKNKKGNIKIFKAFDNTENVVESILKKEKNGTFKEIPLTNSNNIDINKYPKVQTIILKEIEKQYENRDLDVSMEENLYVSKDDNNDTILSIDKNNGHYNVKVLNQKQFKREIQENSLNSKGKVKVFSNPNIPKLFDENVA